jgi:hypothetical protein
MTSTNKSFVLEMGFSFLFRKRQSDFLGSSNNFQHLKCWCALFFENVIYKSWIFEKTFGLCLIFSKLIIYNYLHKEGSHGNRFFCKLLRKKIRISLFTMLHKLELIRFQINN